MILQYTKKVDTNYIHYTFESNSQKIRVVFYQRGNNIQITSEDKIPYIIYGKLSDETDNTYPKFGITYELLSVNNDDLYDTITDVVKDFLNNYNRKVSYNYIKVAPTDSIETKMNIHHQKLIDNIPNIKITEKMKNNDLSKKVFVVEI